MSAAGAARGRRKRKRRPAAGTAGWSEAHVRRLFWRAGFGATPAEARRWAKRGKAATLDFVVNGPPGGLRLRGPEPRIEGRRLDPLNEWGDDGLWWLDRMVRTTYPLQEKLTLFWHDHFATSEQDTPLMLAQNRMLRRRALGSFRDLLGDVTRDPAMQLFLSLADSTKDAPNENYARELMELFTLGKGYSERDVREAARALTGYRADWYENGTVTQCQLVWGLSGVLSGRSGWVSDRRRTDSYGHCRPLGLTGILLCRPSPSEDHWADLIGAWLRPD